MPEDQPQTTTAESSSDDIRPEWMALSDKIQRLRIFPVQLQKKDTKIGNRGSDPEVGPLIVEKVTMDLHRLLYVEDEPDIRAVAEIALKDVGGFELSMCERGEDAVATALRVRPQLIMLDVMMPGLDGITTFRRLREQPQLSGIPVVFLTAKAQKQEVASLMALGAAGVIAKPFEPLTLAGEVRRFWLAHGGD